MFRLPPFLRAAALALAALLLAACATGPRVTTDGDPQADAPGGVGSHDRTRAGGVGT